MRIENIVTAALEEHDRYDFHVPFLFLSGIELKK